jgi:hypothetical protein
MAPAKGPTDSLHVRANSVSFSQRPLNLFLQIAASHAYCKPHDPINPPRYPKFDYS